MDATATLTQTPTGLHLRLSSRGCTFASYTAPAERGEPATDTADRMLADYNWTVTTGWTQERSGTYGRWTALIDHTGDDNQPKEQP